MSLVDGPLAGKVLVLPREVETVVHQGYRYQEMNDEFLYVGEESEFQDRPPPFTRR